MSKILVFQHVPHEILGTFDPLLKKKGFRIKYVNFGRFPDANPTLDGYDGLIVLGGPMNVSQADQFPHLNYEKDIILDAMKKGIPIMGICLGAQLIASALGASVGSAPQKEIGWYDVHLTSEGQLDPLFKDFRFKEKIFQWHGDMFEVPTGAKLLATAPTCPHQAFSYDDKTYALQFHLEVNEPLIERWLRVTAHLRELEEYKGLIDPDKIREETRQHIKRLQKLSRHTFNVFLKLFGHEKSAVRLTSR